MPHKKVFHIVYRLQKTPLNTLKRIIILKHNKLRFVKNLSFTPKNGYKFLVFKELNSPKNSKSGAKWRNISRIEGQVGGSGRIYGLFEKNPTNLDLFYMNNTRSNRGLVPLSLFFHSDLVRTLFGCFPNKVRTRSEQSPKERRMRV